MIIDFNNVKDVEFGVCLDRVKRTNITMCRLAGM